MICLRVMNFVVCVMSVGGLAACNNLYCFGVIFNFVSVRGISGNFWFAFVDIKEMA
jgi:hypothetical protein